MIKKKKIKILFVCLGNICRSPAAEGVMIDMVKAAGYADVIEIRSSAIGSWHIGELPDKRMRKQAALRGYDLCSRAAQIHPEDLDYYDYIFVMDRDIHRQVSVMATNDSQLEKIHHFAAFLSNDTDGGIIPDPYYGNLHDFDHVLDLIEDGTKNIIRYIENKENLREI